MIPKNNLSDVVCKSSIKSSNLISDTLKMWNTLSNQIKCILTYAPAKLHIKSMLCIHNVSALVLNNWSICMYLLTTYVMYNKTILKYEYSYLTNTTRSCALISIMPHIICMFYDFTTLWLHFMIPTHLSSICSINYIEVKNETITTKICVMNSNIGTNLAKVILHCNSLTVNSFYIRKILTHYF